jgi:hypothetical protein
MKDHDYFLDTGVMYYKDKDNIYLYSELDTRDKSKELIINSNGMDDMMALNRNLSVLRNKLHAKMDRGRTLKGSDIEYGPSGFVLVSYGNGTAPIWENPTKVIEGMQSVEWVDNEQFILDSSTFNRDLFSTTVNADGFVYNIAFTDPGAYVTLKPYTIHITSMYQIKANVTPLKLQISKVVAGVIYTTDSNIDSTSIIVASTDRGDLILKDVVATYDGVNGKITTSTMFSVVYALYIFNLKIDLDIHSGTRNYKTQNIDSFVLGNDKIDLTFTMRECAGNVLDMVIYGRQNTSLNSLKIDLYTSEFLG